VYIHDPDNSRYDAFVFSMDTEAIIDGVVSAWDEVIVANSAQTVGATSADLDSDSLIRELRQARTMGAWKDADTLHFALLLTPSPIVNPRSTEASMYAEAFNARLAAARQTNAISTMESGQYCLYQGIDLFFARLSVHTTDGRSDITTEAYHRLKDLD
jgi:hypothetical protein